MVSFGNKFLFTHSLHRKKKSMQVLSRQRIILVFVFYFLSFERKFWWAPNIPITKYDGFKRIEYENFIMFKWVMKTPTNHYKNLTPKILIGEKLYLIFYCKWVILQTCIQMWTYLSLFSPKLFVLFGIKKSFSTLTSKRYSVFFHIFLQFFTFRSLIHLKFIFVFFL